MASLFLKNKGYWFVVLCVIIADQATKFWAVHYLTSHPIVHVFPGLDFLLAYNFGAAFSFLSHEAGWQRWAFIVVAIFVLKVVLNLLRSPDLKRVERLAFYLLIGGALGNLFDRVFLGYVVDFIQVYYKTWYFPAFNIADTAITIAGCLLALCWVGVV